MEQAEKLTKENFWNELQKKYPEQMKLFCDWVDDYKKSHDWKNLFAKQNLLSTDGGAIESRTPKYYEVPFELQVGMFFRFGVEHDEDPDRPEKVREGLKEAIEDLFDRLKRKQGYEGHRS